MLVSNGLNALIKIKISTEVETYIKCLQYATVTVFVFIGLEVIQQLDIILPAFFLFLA